MNVWIHILFISSIIAALIINYLVWFKGFIDNAYERWSKYSYGRWLSELEFMILYKAGVIVWLFCSIGFYIWLLISL